VFSPAGPSTAGYTRGTGAHPATREGGADAVTSWNGWEA